MELHRMELHVLPPRTQPAMPWKVRQQMRQGREDVASPFLIPSLRTLGRFGRAGSQMLSPYEMTCQQFLSISGKAAVRLVA